MTLLKVSAISKKGDRDLILKDISFSQRKLQKVALAGETGSGKSTLLKIIAGLIQPDSGEVLFAGEKVRGPSETLVPGHSAICYLSQHFDLPKFLTVAQVLSYANALSEAAADSLYKICRIDHLLNRKTDALSGGEKQRIALARLLASRPRMLLLDEPFSNLDATHKDVLKSVLNDICERLKITCVLVSHEPNDTLAWADQIIVLKSGEIVQQGPPQEIYKQPLNEYVAGLFGPYTLIKPQLFKLFRVSPRKNMPVDGSIVVRPEHIKIVGKKSGAVKGRITQVNFFGGQVEIKVAVSGKGQQGPITLRAKAADLKNGDTVYIAFPATALRYIQHD